MHFLFFLQLIFAINAYLRISKLALSEACRFPNNKYNVAVVSVVI